MTWEIPDFAYFNNQLLLHITVAAYNPLHSHLILSPGFHFPSFEGWPILRNLSFDELFETGHTRIRSVDIGNALPARVATVREALRIAEDNCVNAVQVTNQYEDLWAKMYTLFVVRVFLLGRVQDVHDIIADLKYTSPLRICIEAALADQSLRISGAVGVHIRTWPKSFSLISNACEQINRYNPLRIMFSCNFSRDLVIENIEMVRKLPAQRIFLATDDLSHPLVRDVKTHYKNMVTEYHEKDMQRCLRKQDLIEQDVEFWLAVGYPIVQNEILAYADHFVGSFFSTFSQVIALKRRVERTTFFQSKFQRMVYSNLLKFCFCIVLALMFAPLIVKHWRSRRLQLTL